MQWDSESSTIVQASADVSAVNYLQLEVAWETSVLCIATHLSQVCV